MVDEHKQFAAEVLSILKDSTKEFINDQAVQQYLADQAERFAMWKTKALLATDASKKDEYEGNLRDILAQLDISIASRLMALETTQKSVLKKVLEVAGNFIIRMGPALLKGLVPGL